MKMIREIFQWLHNYTEKYRFRMLLVSTLLVLILPAFAGGGIMSNLIFVICMSFLFIQSMYVATSKRKKIGIVRILAVICMVLLIWLNPLGIHLNNLDIFNFFLFVGFFIFIIIALIRFMTHSEQVTTDVIIVAINVYLLFGIIAGSLASMCNDFYPAAYNFPAHISNPRFIDFLYYSYVTMTTLGYGEITPAIQETQTLAYMIAIFGQLYVAIIIAVLVGKYLVHSAKSGSDK